MSLSILQKDDFKEFVGSLTQQYRLAGPVAKDGGFVFDLIDNPADLRLDYGTTILPPKKYFLPVREVLFDFDLSTGQSVSVDPQDQPTVLLGLHTCDLHAIQLLNSVFKTGFVDPYFSHHRQQTILISIECLAPCDEHAFCKSMGTLTAEEGYDLHLTDLGDAYAIEVGSEAGRELIERYTSVRRAEVDEMDRLNAVISEKWAHFPYRLDFDVSDLPSLLNMSLKSPLWTELGERCLGCASCTNVCPTCYCFDVHDEVGLDLQKGQRVRTWDSCQLDGFATVAGGHNFRQSRAMRQRHRFMRKGKYVQEAYGATGCVGCGRCARSCLVDINPVSVFNELFRSSSLCSGDLRQKEGVTKKP